MITDEARMSLTNLALRALDTITGNYGAGAVLEDAVLIFEVSVPDGERANERATEVHAEATTHRAVVTVGLATTYASAALHGFCDDREEEG